MDPDRESPEAAPPTPPVAEAPSSTDEAELGAPESADPADTLSPAVRRLVRQYDLDVTGIHGTGPSGRIRVGDVIGMLGARSDATGARPGDAARKSPADADERAVERTAEHLAATLYRSAAADAPRDAATSATPTSTVFECDLSRVLTHRKQQRKQGVEILLTSYCLVACGEALKAVPEIAVNAGAEQPGARFGVLITSAEGDVRATLVDAADDSPLGSIADRLRALDEALRASTDSDFASASLLIHHYGMSGSLLATPTPLGPGHAASLGVGRVRRVVVVRTTDGDETPRVAAVCYISLSFLPDRIALARANRFLAQLVRVLEHWPE